MKRAVRITILKSEVDQKLAEQYAVLGFEACPFHKAGPVSYTHLDVYKRQVMNYFFLHFIVK